MSRRTRDRYITHGSLCRCAHCIYCTGGTRPTGRNFPAELVSLYDRPDRTDLLWASRKILKILLDGRTA